MQAGFISTGKLDRWLADPKSLKCAKLAAASCVRLASRPATPELSLRAISEFQNDRAGLNRCLTKSNEESAT
jgi:hypothetical protein